MFLNFFNRDRDAARTHLYRKIAVSFFSISVVVALGIFYVSFSWATVTLTPKVKGFTDTARLVVQDTSTPSSDHSIVLGHIVQQELEGVGTFTPSQTKTVTTVGKMTGGLTVVNNSDHAQQLRATTRFLSSRGILFRSQEFAVVPAHGSAVIPVIADQDGQVTGLESDTFTLPGLWPGLQKSIYGTSLNSQAGGSQDVRVISADDITHAQDEVQKKLEEKFSLLLDAEKPKVSAASVLTVTHSDVLEQHTNHEVGQEAKDFELRLKVRFTAVLYDEQQALAAVSQSLTTRFSQGYQLIPLQSDALTASIASIDTTAKTAVLSLAVHGGKIRTDDVLPYQKRDLLGLSRNDVLSYFQGYDDIEHADVSFYPFWVTRAPLLVDHIRIVIKH